MFLQYKESGLLQYPLNNRMVTSLGDWNIKVFSWSERITPRSSALTSCAFQNVSPSVTDLSLKAHVIQQTTRCYSYLCRIKSCRRALTGITAATAWLSQCHKARLLQHHSGRKAACSNSVYWYTRHWTAWHHVISTNCASQFRLFQPFCSPFRCSWWFGSTQNKATTRQPGILCGWSGRLEQSTTAHSFGTYIINFQNMLKTHLFSRSYFTD